LIEPYAVLLVCHEKCQKYLSNHRRPTRWGFGGATSPNRRGAKQHPTPRLSSPAQRRPYATLHLLSNAGFQNHQKILCGYINITPGALRGVCLFFLANLEFIFLPEYTNKKHEVTWRYGRRACKKSGTSSWIQTIFKIQKRANWDSNLCYLWDYCFHLIEKRGCVLSTSMRVDRRPYMFLPITSLFRLDWPFTKGSFSSF